MKKNILIITLLGLFAHPLFALAGSPVLDPTVAGTTAAGTATGATTTSQQILKTLKDYGLDTVAYTLAQKLGQKMASLAINKANGGASKDKDPNYVKEFGDIFKQIEQQQRDLYTTKLLTSSNPYSREIAKEMLQSPYADQLSQFTLGNFLSNGADVTTAKDDLSAAGSNGLAFFGSLAKPQNTPFGASLIAQSQLSQQIVDKSKTESLKLTGSGFKPDTKCNTSIADYKNSVGKIVGNSDAIDGASSAIDAAKAELAAAKNAVISAIDTYGVGSPEANTASDNYDALEASTNQTISTQQGIIQANGINSGQQAEGLAKDTAGCIEEFVKNPVSAVQTITTEGGKFGMDMTKNIQGWGQIVAGLFVSLFNGFINTGLSSLKADYGQAKTKQTNTGGPEQFTQKVLGGGTADNTNFATAPTIIIDLRNDFESSMKAVEENIDILKETTTQLFLVPSRLAHLDMCLPGPDTIGLNARLDKYYEFQTAWIQKSSATGSDAKNNVDQQFVISTLEQSFSIAKAEMLQDLNDDAKNIPGAGAMRTMINTFPKKKALLTNTLDANAKALGALSQLRDVNTQLKGSISFLKQLEPTAFATLPGAIFTEAEWEATPQADRDAIYNWMKTHSPNAPVELTGLSAAEIDANHRKYVIKNSWDLWEYPYQFFPKTPVLDADGNPTLDSAGNPITDKKWSDETAEGSSVHADQFLDKKNEIRSIFNNIKDIIPTPYEISKNSQSLVSVKSDITKTDNLIRDCDTIRKLVMGDPTASPAIPAKLGNDITAFLADLIQNKQTYFKSEEVRNGLTLPNIFNQTVSPDDLGCRPYNQSDYPADGNYVDNNFERFQYNGQEYACFGNFGIVYGVEREGTIIDNFNEWVDERGNAYQSIPYIGWPTELYWKSRTLRFNPPPVPDTYGKGWSYQAIDDRGPTGGTVNVNGVIVSTGDGGKSRDVFCRFNAFQRMAGDHGGAVPHPRKNFYCSSKWSDVTVSEALGLFLIDSLSY